VRRSRTFKSWLAAHFRNFVAVKRAGGCGYETEKKLLLAFDHHVHRHAKPPFSRAALTEYLATKDHLCPRSRDNVIAVVWQALAYAKRHGAGVEETPPRPQKPVMQLCQRHPRILTAEEFGALLATARQLSPLDSYGPATTATMLGLLWATGMRIGEAIALDINDLRDRLLTVRAGKFGKSRVLPLQVSTVTALDGYLHHPLRQASTAPSAPLFTFVRRRLHYEAFRRTFIQVCAAAAITGRTPRVHDLRHSFAVHRVADWYAAGRDVNALLPALSTYLGHVSVENTRLYLVDNGVLLDAASALFARGTTALDEVQS